MLLRQLHNSGVIVLMAASCVFFTRTLSAFGDTATQIQFLSGTDKDHTVPWSFTISSGRNAGVLTNIPVPSCWETKGFGTYQYGNNGSVSNDETGTYSTTFAVPEDWKGRRVFLVFEGAFTDTTAGLNGQLAGPTHQGGFYEFRYDVSKNLFFGSKTNTLRVTVRRWSRNASIVKAEEKGDFWNFGGIFRPVYLEAKPASYVERLAVDAKADGRITVDAFLEGITNNATITASVSDLQRDGLQDWGAARSGVRALPGAPLGSEFSTAAPVGARHAVLSASLPTPRPWSAETPNLYTLTVKLLDPEGAVMHVVTNQIGFRTITFSNHLGLFINGRKVVLRGICHHEEWPVDGRTSSRAQSDDDLALIRDMNFNAIRLTHYPHSKEFMEECDRLGFYVLDELTGWQAGYDDVTASCLVKEMIARDVNHPCIIGWDNGNEGGWNRTVDHDSDSTTNLYAAWDPQKRHVFRPGNNAVFENVYDPHYPDYKAFTGALGVGKTAYWPTEILHGLYDGGSGAGLQEFWDAMRVAPNGMGMFLWVFADGGQVRTDLGSIMDVKGQSAPDGILGPFREKEGSYYACKAILSPVQVGGPDTADFRDTLPVANRFDFLNLNQCTFEWQLGVFPRATDPAAAFSSNGLTEQSEGWTTGLGSSAQRSARPSYRASQGLKIVRESGRFAGPSVAPQSAGVIKLPVFPAGWTNFDALRVSAFDPSGNNLYSWTWLLRSPRQIRNQLVGEPGAGCPTITAGVKDDGIILTNGPRVFRFTSNGIIAQVTVSNRTVSFANGPRPVSGPPWNITNLTNYFAGSNYVIRVADAGNSNGFQWVLRPDGWLHLSYHYTQEGPRKFMGVTFDYPAREVTAMKWLGEGPYRVYKNRLAGQEIFGHIKSYNDVWTGQSTNYSASHATATRSQWEYPEFAGYHGAVIWASLETAENPITIATGTTNLFLRVLTPPATDQKNVNVEYPPGDISILDGISPIGDKFHLPDRQGPSGQLNWAKGFYSNEADFFFGPLPRPSESTN